MAVIIGNRGYYKRPHLIKEIGDHEKLKSDVDELVETGIDAKYFDIVKEAMLDVFEGDHGTARYYKIDSIAAGGKTGTVQNPHGEDHSLFLAFAPYDKPEIAISVVVENAGYGSTWAAPIASLMIEKYLKGTTRRLALEERIMNANLNGEEQEKKP